jgi:hypothetical protein
LVIAAGTSSCSGPAVIGWRATWAVNARLPIAAASERSDGAAGDAARAPALGAAGTCSTCSRSLIDRL